MRGDGMSPTPFDSFFHEGETSSGLKENAHASNGLNGINGDSGPSSRPGSTLSHLDHLEERPSSSGRSSTRLDDSPGEGTPDDTFVDGLRIPLDSLSLSFVDVIEDQPSPRSRSPAGLRLPASQTEEGGEEGDGAVEELVCVEALVVRKAGLEGEYFLPEDGWGFGE